MIVRQDFEVLPPKMFLMQIMDTLGKLYCFLWENKDAKNEIVMTWKEICKIYNRNTFRTNLRKLNNEGLISFKESTNSVTIEMVDYSDVVGE